MPLDTSRLGRTLRRGLAPLLLAAVATVHLGLAEHAGLSRWRGGGFGMYAEPHPSLTQVWLAAEGGRRRLGPADDGACPVAPRVARCQRVRTAACLAEVARCLRTPPGPARLELWSPRFALETATLTRQRVASREIAP